MLRRDTTCRDDPAASKVLVGDSGSGVSRGISPEVCRERKRVAVAMSFRLEGPRREDRGVRT